MHKKNIVRLVICVIVLVAAALLLAGALDGWRHVTYPPIAREAAEA